MVICSEALAPRSEGLFLARLKYRGSHTIRLFCILSYERTIVVTWHGYNLQHHPCFLTRYLQLIMSCHDFLGAVAEGVIYAYFTRTRMGI